MTSPPITIADFKPRESGTLRAFFTASLPSSLTLHERSLHTRDGKWWIGFPAKPVVIDGTVQRDESGKVRYGAPLVSFTSPQARDRFTAGVLEALRLAQPQLFGAEAVA
jgi:hypothetical protein